MLPGLSGALAAAAGRVLRLGTWAELPGRARGEAPTHTAPADLDLPVPPLSTDGAANPGEACGQRKPRR